jgi:hypothetical protein
MKMVLIGLGVALAGTAIAIIHELGEYCEDVNPYSADKER